MDKNTLGDGLYAVLDTSKGEILLALEFEDPDDGGQLRRPCRGFLECERKEQAVL